jgi:hypothetical protein
MSCNLLDPIDLHGDDAYQTRALARSKSEEPTNDRPCKLRRRSRQSPWPALHSRRMQARHSSVCQSKCRTRTLHDPSMGEDIGGGPCLDPARQQHGVGPAGERRDGGAWQDQGHCRPPGTNSQRPALIAFFFMYREENLQPALRPQHPGSVAMHTKTRTTNLNTRVQNRATQCIRRGRAQYMHADVSASCRSVQASPAHTFH